MVIYGKDRDATRNTWVADVDGGTMVGEHIIVSKITARFTSDEVGESLSLCDERGGFGLIVPFEDVEGLILRTRENRTGKKGG